MPTWTCPDCERSFGAKGRSHVCVPGTTIEELGSRSISSFQPIAERVRDHLLSLPQGDDELIVDPLDKLVQFKHRSVFAAVRPMTKWTALSFSLKRRLTSSRLSRKVIEHPGGFHHVINIADADEIDDEILDWLTEAFDPSLVDRQAQPSPDDPMVPDDVDLW